MQARHGYVGVARQGSSRQARRDSASPGGERQGRQGMTGRGAVRAARQARHGRLGMARIGLVREARQAWRHIAAPGGNGSAWRGYATITVMEAESITFTRFELGQLYAALGATQLSKLSPDLRAKLRGEFRRLEDESTPVLVPIKLATERPDDESMHSADA